MMSGLTADPGFAVIKVPELEPVEFPVLTPAGLHSGRVFELDCLLCRNAATGNNNKLFLNALKRDNYNCIYVNNI